MDTNINKGELEDLKESGIQKAASLLAASFVNSPGYKYIFEHLDEKKRIEALEWMFDRNLRMVLDRAQCKCVYGCERNSEMVCFFLFQPPNPHKTTMWDLVSNGLLTMPFRFGWQAMTRLLQLIEYHDKVDSDFFKERREQGDLTQYCYLERMVVRPDCQGKGIGTKYLGAALKDMDQKGQSVILSTQEERNVTFYSKLGFKVSHSKRMDFMELQDAEEIINTVMIYDSPGTDCQH